MSSELIAEIMQDYEALSALAAWENAGGSPLATDTAQLSLTLERWRSLQSKLVALGGFVTQGDLIHLTAEGRQFLISLSEIYRGINRLPQYQPILERLRTFSRGTAVDVGCGAGFMLHQLASLGYNPVYGYDLHQISLDIAAARLLDLNVEAHLLCEDATQMRALGDSTVSVIFCRNAFQYFNHQKLAQTLRRVLLPGGIVVAEVIGLRYYVDKRHYKNLATIFRRHTLSTLFVIGRTLIYEVTGRQFRFGATSPEVGFTSRSVRRFARWAGLEIVEISPAPTHLGYLITLRKPDAR